MHTTSRMLFLIVLLSGANSLSAATTPAAKSATLNTILQATQKPHRPIRAMLYGTGLSNAEKLAALQEGYSSARVLGSNQHTPSLHVFTKLTETEVLEGDVIYMVGLTPEANLCRPDQAEDSGWWGKMENFTGDIVGITNRSAPTPTSSDPTPAYWVGINTDRL